MKLGTGPWIERRYRFRLSLHTFRWGVHLKLRQPSGLWRHFVVKADRGPVYRQAKARRSLWIAWWQTWRGEKGMLNGWRLHVHADRLPHRPRPGRDYIPVFPTGRKPATARSSAVAPKDDSLTASQSEGV